jgi:hypothetical protein
MMGFAQKILGRDRPIVGTLYEDVNELESGNMMDRRCGSGARIVCPANGGITLSYFTASVRFNRRCRKFEPRLE